MTTEAHAQRPAPAHTLQCREIWGGSRATETELAVPGLDAWVLSRPVEEAGGDIYFVGLCGHGVLSRFVVADVSGHGAAAASLARKLHALMTEHMNTIDQSELVRALNGEFASLAGQGEFATAIVMTYHALQDRLIVVNAGHPHPLWYSRRDGQWRLLRHDIPQAARELLDLPLGIVTESGYRQFALALEPGDAVVIYTDSLPEARDPQGSFLGTDRLLRLARTLRPDGARDLGRSLLKAVVDYRGGQKLDDDATVLALHHNAQDPPGAA